MVEPDTVNRESFVFFLFFFFRFVVSYWDTEGGKGRDVDNMHIYKINSLMDASGSEWKLKNN